MDAEKLELEDQSFDAAVSKWGLTFFPNCHRALKEVLRVLKPGGRFSAMVFGRPEGTQFLTVAARAAAKHLLSGVVASAGGPTDFQFAAEGTLEAALNSAGFANVYSRRFAVMISCDSPEVYWNLLIAGTGRLSHHLQHASAEVREAVVRDVRKSVERYQSGEGIRLPIEVVIGYGERPSKSQEEVATVPDRTVNDLVSEALHGIRQLPASEAARLVQNRELLVVDVRSRAEFVDGHIPHAISVPRGRLESAAPAVIPDVRTRVLVSGDGPAAVFAARTLIELGCRDVAVIAGGFSAWKTAGLAVVQ
jgi:rhodanese-related sulfurtransferase